MNRFCTKALAWTALFFSCALVAALFTVVGSVPIQSVLAAQNNPPSEYNLTVSTAGGDETCKFWVNPPGYGYQSSVFSDYYAPNALIEADTSVFCPSRYEFDYWESNVSSINGAHRDYVDFNISKNSWIVAHFKERKGKLTVYVDEPDPGSGTVFVVIGEECGHTFWKFDGACIPTDLTSSLGTFGFWPNGQASTTGSSGCKTWTPCPGRVQDDSEHSYDSWQTYEITYDQLVAGLQYTKNLLENTPSYEVETFNCTDAAIGAAAAAGVGLPDAHGTYINYGVSFSGNCPGILGPRLTNHNY